MRGGALRCLGELDWRVDRHVALGRLDWLERVVGRQGELGCLGEFDQLGRGRGGWLRVCTGGRRLERQRRVRGIRQGCLRAALGHWRAAT